MTGHLDMTQLIALRDGDRSEPGLAEAQRHFGVCLHCQAELERLHQRTARLRALPLLAPASNEYPAVRARVVSDRRQRQWRYAGVGGLVAAAAVAVAIVGRDLVRPPRLDARELLQSEISRSQQLEQKLHALSPEARVIDGRSAVVVVQLEDKIAALDAELARTAQMKQVEKLQREINLWQQRVGLMNALVDVHLTNASNVGL